MPRKTAKRPLKEDEIKIRVTAEEKRLFEKAAAERGQMLSSWLRLIATDVCAGRLVPKG